MASYFTTKLESVSALAVMHACTVWLPGLPELVVKVAHCIIWLHLFCHSIPGVLQSAWTVIYLYLYVYACFILLCFVVQFVNHMHAFFFILSVLIFLDGFAIRWHNIKKLHSRIIQCPLKWTTSRGEQMFVLDGFSDYRVFYSQENFS